MKQARIFASGRAWSRLALIGGLSLLPLPLLAQATQNDNKHPRQTPVSPPPPPRRPTTYVPTRPPIQRPPLNDGASRARPMPDISYGRSLFGVAPITIQRDGSIQYGSPASRAPRRTINPDNIRVSIINGNNGNSNGNNGRSVGRGRGALPDRFPRRREGHTVIEGAGYTIILPNGRDNGCVPVADYAPGTYIPAYAFAYPTWGGYYFPDSWAFYPYYYPNYIGGTTVLSPYVYYYGAAPSFIGVGNVLIAQPSYVYVPVPVYVDGRYQGWQRDALDDYYLNRRNNDENDLPRPKRDNSENGEESVRPVKKDSALNAAIADIQKAWMDRDIDALSKHVKPEGKIAVYLRGKYQYSLEVGDYLDMTRDAFRITKTLLFTLDKAQKKENGIYTVTGRHTYEDKDGNSRSVYLSYVLEKQDDGYVITQVGTAPDQIEE